MWKYYTCFLFVIMYLSVTAQELPKVIPPSPSAMQFLKYADYPVSNFTGIPEIKIPLYEIQQGDLTLPVFLQYHASGTKPSDPNGIIAMGWSLVCGATIYRTISDEADETRTPISDLLTGDQLNNLSVLDRDNVLKPWELYGDTEPDIFSYSIDGASGKFALKRDNQRTPMLMPFKPVKVIPKIIGGQLDFEMFNAKGMKYEFERVEAPSDSETTGWNVKKMTSSSDLLNVINFIYESGPLEFLEDKSYYFYLDDNGSASTVTSICNFPDSEDPIEDFMLYSTPDENPHQIARQYSKAYIKEINFNQGKLLFIKDATSKMLNSIEVYDLSGVLKRKITLERSLKTYNKYLLKEIKFWGETNEFINSYKLSYHDEESGAIPLDSNVDLWGYLTDGIADNMFPAFTIPFYNPTGGTVIRTLGSNSRTTNEIKMKTFVLKEIHYPTGGYSIFDYEANKRSGTGNSYSNYYSSYSVGGLRVKTITDYSSLGSEPYIRTYKYGITEYDESGFGIMDIFPTIDDFRYTQRTYVTDSYYINFPWQSFRNNYYLSNPYTNITPQGSPVVYPNVTEYRGDANGYLDKTVYHFSYQGAEYKQFDTNGDMPFVQTPYYKRFMYPFMSWKSGNLLSKSYFKNNSGIFKKVKEESYNYSEVLRESLSALYMERFVNYASNLCAGTIPPYQNDLYVYSRGVPGPLSVFNYGDYSLKSTLYELNKSGVEEYDDQEVPTYNELTEYFYENASHGQLTTKKTYTSKGDNLIYSYKYPHDYIGQQVYSEMVNTKHNWSPVVEQAVYKSSINSEPLSTARTNYSFWNGNNNLIYPSSVETSQSGSTPEPRIRYHGYDNNGNVLSVSKEGGPKINYLYSYKGSYPVARIENADYATLESVLGAQTIDNLRDYTSSAVISATLAPLRTHPGLQNAQITTYTYQPLVGMTSMTDAKGQTTYYEYDGFQRLSTVKNQDGNVLKQYDYHYKP